MMENRSMWAIAAIIFITYTLSLYPSIPGGDSGEIAAESCLLGTIHPPGYPLWIAAAKLFEKIPFPRFIVSRYGMQLYARSTKGFRFNLMSSLFNSVASALVGATAREILRIIKMDCMSLIIGSFVAFSFAFSPLAWEYSITAEVFALNNLLMSAILYTIVLLYKGRHMTSNSPNLDYKQREIRLLRLGAFLSGLSLCNQHTSALQLIVVIPFVAFGFKRHVFKDATSFLFISCAFLLGLSPYSYLYWAAFHPKKGSWGDLRTLRGFLVHFLRAEYGTLKLGVRSGPETMWERVYQYIRSSLSESFHLGPSLSLVAVLWSVFAAILLSLKNRNTNNSSSNKVADNEVDDARTATLLSLMTCFTAVWVTYTLIWHGVFSNLPLSSPMAFAVHARFWLQPNLLLSIMSGIGLAVACDACARICNKGKLYNSDTTVARPQNSRNSALIQWSIIIAMYSLYMSHRFSQLDKSHQGWVMHRYGAFILNSLPRNAILATHTDLDWNTARYLQSCEGLREDVTLLSFQLMPYPWFKSKQAPLYRDNVVFPDLNQLATSSKIPLSTARGSEGNALIVHSFLTANGAQAQELNWLRNAVQLVSKQLRFNFEVNISEDLSNIAPDFEFSWALDGKRHNSQNLTRRCYYYRKEKTNSAFESLPAARSHALFIDMQTVDDGEFDSLGLWRGLTLMPWGLVYRALPPLNITTLSPYHKISYALLNELQDTFRHTLQETSETQEFSFIRKFPRGTWEFAAMSVYFDAHYQLGVALLSYGIARYRDGSHESVLLVLDRLVKSVELLSYCMKIAEPVGLFSVSVYDLRKNTVVAMMRLRALQQLAMQFKDSLHSFLKSDEGKRTKALLLDRSVIKNILKKTAQQKLVELEYKLLTNFVKTYNKDVNIAEFLREISALETLIA